MTEVSTDNTPRPAATVVVLRDGAEGPELFMVRRHAGTGAFRGAHVFPGGRVDAGDVGGRRMVRRRRQARRQLPICPQQEAVAFHVCAARELFEEAGVLLARDRSGAFVSLADPCEPGTVSSLPARCPRASPYAARNLRTRRACAWRSIR